MIRSRGPVRELPVRVLAVAAIASITFVPQAALAGGCGPEGATSSGLARSTASSGPAFSAVPDALTIAEQMDRNPYVYMADPFDEGPETVVDGGFCTRQLAGLCYRMVSTKDASVIVFHSAKIASGYAGCGDDTAKEFGRMVVSYGSPTRSLASDWVAPRRSPGR